MSELLDTVRGLSDDILEQMARHTVESNFWPPQITLVLVLEVERRRNDKEQVKELAN